MPFKRSNNALRREDGAAAVEFAIVVTLLLTVVFAIIGFGSAFSRMEVFQNAAREGARVAAVGGSAGDAVAATVSAAAPYDLAETPTVSVGSGGSECTEDTVGQPVTVSWTQPFEIDLLFAPKISLTRTVSGVFRCE